MSVSKACNKKERSKINKTLSIVFITLLASSFSTLAYADNSKSSPLQINIQNNTTLNVQRLDVQQPDLDRLSRVEKLVSAETPILPPAFSSYGVRISATADDGLVGNTWALPARTDNIDIPLTGNSTVVSGFGSRTAPCSNGCSSFHLGNDFSAPSGTPIKSIADGVVLKAGTATGRGNYVVIGHNIKGERVISLYEHMLTPDFPVQVGQTVKMGQQIGVVGSTGFSTGSHLHLGIQVQEDHTYVDPTKWFAAQGRPF